MASPRLDKRDYTSKRKACQSHDPSYRNQLNAATVAVENDAKDWCHTNIVIVEDELSKFTRVVKTLIRTSISGTIHAFCTIIHKQARF